MSVMCANPACTHSRPTGFASFVSLLCGEGQGHHRGNSQYAHLSCAHQLSPSLLDAGEKLPYGLEVVVTFDPAERVASQRQLTNYYACGQPGCLAAMLSLHGSSPVKEILELGRSDPLGALERIPPELDARARQQLQDAVEAIAREAGLPGAGAIVRQWTAQQPEDGDKKAPTGAVLPAGARQVLLVGAGAVGGLLATRLLLAGHRVVVLGRPEQVAAIRAGGFRVQEGSEVAAARPTALISALGEAFTVAKEYDLFLLAVKAYDAQQVLSQVPNAKFPLPFKVLTVQSGVGTEELAAQVLGPERVLAGALTIPVSSAVRGNVIIEQGDCGLALAPYVRGQPIDEWVAMFQAAGIPTVSDPDYRAIKWSRLFLSVIANATCAILNRKPGVIYRHRPTFLMERGMLREVLAVMKAMDVPLVDLPGYPTRSLARMVGLLPAGLAQSMLPPQIERRRGDKMPSLYLDLVAGRPESEVVFLNGKVVQHGRKVGVKTPVNEALTDTLIKIANGVLRWDDFRGKPPALEARVRAAKRGELRAELDG